MSYLVLTAPLFVHTHRILPRAQSDNFCEVLQCETVILTIGVPGS